MRDLSVQISDIMFKHWRHLNDKPIQELFLDYLAEIDQMVKTQHWQRRDAFNLARSFMEEQIRNNLAFLYRHNFRDD